MNGDAEPRREDTARPLAAGDRSSPTRSDAPQDRLPGDRERQWEPGESIPETPPWRPRDSSAQAASSADGDAAPHVRPTGSSRSSRAVKIGLTAAVAGVGLWLLWPEDEPTTHAGVCVDKDTNTRLPDQECDGTSTGHAHVGWYFFAYGMSAPRVGAPVSGGTFDTPRGTSYVTGGVDSRGGTVSSATVHGGKTTVVRGGFGGSGKSSGG